MGIRHPHKRLWKRIMEITEGEITIDDLLEIPRKTVAGYEMLAFSCRCVIPHYVGLIDVDIPSLKNPLSQEEIVSERLEQPGEQEKKRLTPAEIYRVAADIYESLPEGQELAVIEALCNMVGRTAVNLQIAKYKAMGVECQSFPPSAL